MKRFIFALGVLVVLAVASPAAAADGAVVSYSQSTVNGQLSLLQRMVVLTSYLRALQAGIPAAAHDDEGMVTVAVSEDMRFACADKVTTEGQWCVRHVGELGESYIDLSAIEGFPYNENLSYTLKLMRVRDGDDSYVYHLLQIVDVGV